MHMVIPDMYCSEKNPVESSQMQYESKCTVFVSPLPKAALHGDLLCPHTHAPRYTMYIL